MNRRLFGELERLYLFASVMSLLTLGVVFIFGGIGAFGTALLLSLLEITFSFDNAIINAKVLGRMSYYWQRIFMTLGILIAVFGARLLIPACLVIIATHQNPLILIHTAIAEPKVYAQGIAKASPMINAFGGVFLGAIFADFMLGGERDIYWLETLERGVARANKGWYILLLWIAGIVGISSWLLAGPHTFIVLSAGAMGGVVYILMRFLTEMWAPKEKHRRAKAGLLTFLYLELLDVSFSLDSVVGAFAITANVLLIAAGLGVGALWVRSMTVHIVRRGTLARYRYLDHGAHYAIGVLSLILLLGLKYTIPEAVTGTIGLGIILISLFDSIRYNRQLHIE